MNILIVSENFFKGGLETHINTYYEKLKDRHNLYYLFGRYTESKYLIGANITCGCDFSYDDTVKNLLQDTDKIIAAIKKYNIDVVHVHPFYSVFPAIFACNATKTKLVYTLHGRSSVNFISAVNHSVFYSFALENLFSRIFCVSKEVANWLLDFKTDIATYLPNFVDESIYTEAKVTLNKKWALISRLSFDKYSEIIKLLSNIDSLDIDTLDIYGDGEESATIKDFASKLNCKCKINFMGYCENINEIISEGYTGIIGQGRASLEGLVKNLPVLLMGYNKIVGVIDTEIYNSIKNKNFIPGHLPEIDFSKLNDQIKKINNGDYVAFQHREKVVQEFGIKLTDKYINLLDESEARNSPLIENLLEDLKNPDLADEQFCTSQKVFNLLRNRLGPFTHSFALKNSINLYGEIFTLKNEINRLNEELAILKHEEFTMLKNNVSKQNEAIDFLNRAMAYENNVGLIAALKRDLRKIKGKIFKK